MEKLASPIVHIPNYGVFDFSTGHTEIVDLTTGGNPNLLPQRKHVRSIGLNLSPFGKGFRISPTYEVADIRNQTGDISALTPFIESVFPDRFVRDSTGRLVSVTYQPANFYRERTRDLNITLNANGSVGRKKQGKDGKDAGRPYYYAGAGPIIHLSDKLQLRPGTPVLDILAGDTFKGWGSPRVTSYFFGGIGYLGNSVSIGGWYQGGARVRSDRPESDLYFSGVFKLNLTGTLSVHHFTPHTPWTSHLQLKLEVENALDLHQHVHDANGNEPRAFQQDYLDPIGRTVKFTIRKLL
jgi:hypothetical protein